jgi:hypothetical protein
MDKTKIILKTLRHLGFEPVQIDEGQYKFEYQMVTMTYFPDEDDPSFFRISVPCVEEITSENEENINKAIAHTVNAIKYIRINSYEDIHIWLQYDHYLHFPNNVNEDELVTGLEDLIEHMIRVLYYSYITFKGAIPDQNEETPQYPDTGNSTNDPENLEEEFQAMLARYIEEKEMEDIECDVLDMDYTDLKDDDENEDGEFDEDEDEWSKIEREIAKDIINKKQ